MKTKKAKYPQRFIKNINDDLTIYVTTPLIF